MNLPPFFSLTFFNTLHHQLEPFIPLNPDSIGLYCCGPTVYNYAHIGNFRAFLFEDVLRRTLELAGYSVRHVLNITDVGHLSDDGDDGEDKIIRAARESGKGVWEIAEFFTKAFLADCQKLNLLPTSVTCKATDHIQTMVDFILRLEEKGYTYRAGGNIYFDTSQVPEYGKMGFIDKQEDSGQSRVHIDSYKRNSRDFVLWFTQSKFQNQAMKWESPWGTGYPGWHIECSAMSEYYLGEHFDIHCGGVDHVAVHHSNEIAQSDCVHEKKSVNYWLHNEFLVLKDGKMSKSKGDFLTLSSLQSEGFDPLDYRYFLLGAHYRSQLTFTWEALTGARSARKKILKRLKVLYLTLSTEEKIAISLHHNELSTQANIKTHIQFFFDSMGDDLNTPRALACLWKVLKDHELSACEVCFLVFYYDQVLGLKWKECITSTLQKFPQEEIPEEILNLAKKRLKAKQEKKFEDADSFRNQILDRGYKILDTNNGYKIEKSTTE